MKFLISDGYQKTSLNQEHKFNYWRDIICDEFIKLDCEKPKQSNFSGELRGGIGIADVKFSEVIAAPHSVVRSRHQIAKSSEANFLISFQIAQQALIKQNGREVILSPGSFALYDSTEPYSLSFNENFHQFIVHMPKEVLSRHLMHPEQYTAISISGTAGLGAILSNFIFSLVNELKNIQKTPTEFSENLVNMIAMAFSSSIMLKEVGDHSIVRESLKNRIRQYIDNNLSNSDLSNKNIADSQGISLRYLHKLFQDDDASIHAMILHKRLERGRKLLNDPAYLGHSIERIAYSLGFSSSAHFSRSFKKHYNMPPSEIRNTQVAEET